MKDERGKIVFDTGTKWTCHPLCILRRRCAASCCRPATLFYALYLKLFETANQTLQKEKPSIQSLLLTFVLQLLNILLTLCSWTCVKMMDEVKRGREPALDRTREYLLTDEKKLYTTRHMYSLRSRVTFSKEDSSVMKGTTSQRQQIAVADVNIRQTLYFMGKFPCLLPIEVTVDDVEEDVPDVSINKPGWRYPFQEDWWGLERTGSGQRRKPLYCHAGCQSNMTLNESSTNLSTKRKSRIIPFNSEQPVSLIVLPFAYLFIHENFIQLFPGRVWITLLEVIWFWFVLSSGTHSDINKWVSYPTICYVWLFLAAHIFLGASPKLSSRLAGLTQSLSFFASLNVDC